MNRIVVSTVAMLVAVVGFAMVGEDQEASAGLFGNKCCKPACCEPAAPACCPRWSATSAASSQDTPFVRRTSKQKKPA